MKAAKTFLREQHQEVFDIVEDYIQTTKNIIIMAEKDYYPMGAYNDPSAPYNQQDDIPVKEYDCEVQVTIAKEMPIGTQDYTCEDDECGIYYDVSGVNWNDEYRERHYSVIQMLGELKKYLQEEINSLREKIHSHKASVNDWDRWYLIIEMIKDCDDWVEIDLCASKI